MFRIVPGDALTILRTMPADSVHLCVTSPPYWRLRDYNTGRWEGGRPARRSTGWTARSWAIPDGPQRRNIRC